MEEQGSKESQTTTKLLPFSKHLEKDVNLVLSNDCFKNEIITEIQKLKIPKLERLKQEPYPSVHLLSRFSKLVYDISNTNDSRLPSGWMLLTTATNRKLMNKYFGAVFFNPTLQQLIVAHRGTDIKTFGALWTDFKGIYGNKCKSVGQISSAATFADRINQVIQEVNKNPEISIQLSFTGHSLGGWLAQITTFTVEYLRMDEKYFFQCIDPDVNCHAHTVVFDNPGCEEMLQKLKRAYDLRCYGLLFLSQLDMTAYVSAPNRINTLNHHVGSLFRMEIDCNDMTFFQKHTILYEEYSHNIGRISLFLDPSGKFSHHKIHEIVDWPVNGIMHNQELKSFFKYGNISNNYHVESHENLMESNTGHFYTGLRYQKSDLKSEACSISIFTQEEFWLLECWDALRRKGVKLEKVEEFFHDKQFPYNELPDFKIDNKERKIFCNSEGDLKMLIGSCKQLLRWFPKETNDVMKVQASLAPASSEAMLHAATTNFIISLNGADLKFFDVLSVREFLQSSTKYIYNISTHQDCLHIEVLRIYKIIQQIKEENVFPDILGKYVNTNRFVLMKWKHFVALFKFIDLSYIFQENCDISLIIIDFSSVHIKNKHYSILQSMSKLIEGVNKKLIFLSNDLNKNELLSCFNENVVMKTESKDILFSDLYHDSQMLILNNIFIKVQNTLWHLDDILGLDKIQEPIVRKQLDEMLNSSVISQFIAGGKRIEVNHECPIFGPSEVSQLNFYKEFKIDEFIQFITKGCWKYSMFFLTMLQHEQDAFKKLKNEFGNRDDILKIVSVQNDTESLKEFAKYCYNNQDKQIYWFQFDSHLIHLQQICNSQFYMQRQFNCEFYIKTNKRLQQKIENPDLFIFSNVRSETVEQRISFFEKLYKQIYLVEESVLLAESEMQAQQIFDRESHGKRSVHWFIVEEERERQRYIWKRSKGSLDNLRDHIASDKGSSLDETELLAQNLKAIIIADGPGAGKSTTLSKTISRIRNHLVIRINLKDCGHIYNLSNSIILDEVVEFLWPEVNSKSSHLIKCLVKYLLKHKSKLKVFLLFDGFDEIKADTEEGTKKLQKNVINLLSYLNNETEAVMWITTRDNRKKLLEDSLSVFAIEFDKIIESKLEKFLKVFWLSILSLELGQDDVTNMSGIDEEIRFYILDLFHIAKQIFGKEIANFIGVPLQVRMLAEVIAPYIASFRPYSGFQIEIPNNILDLFQRFIEGKYEIYFKQKTKLSLGLTEVTRQWLVETLSEKHQYLAFKKVLFDENEFSKWSCAELLELNSTGLIQFNSTLTNFDFIDRNIADYFIADMVMNLLKTKDKQYLRKKYPNLENLLLEVLFVESEHKVIRVFLDAHFSKLLCPAYEMQFYGKKIAKLLTSKRFVNDLYGKMNCTPFHILVSDECIYILQFILSALKDDQSDAEDYIRVHVIRNKHNETAFYLALKLEISSAIEEYLDFIATCAKNLQKHFLLATIFRKAQDEICQEIKTLSAHIKKDGKYQELEQLHDDIKSKYKYICTFHKAAEDGMINEVKECFKNINDDIFQHYLMLATDEDGSTALLLAVKRNQKEIVEYLIENGANVRTADTYDMTCVAWAAKRGHLNMIKYLIDEGCDYKKSDRNRINPMQHAAKNGQLDVLQYFIDILKFEVNYKDRFGNSALAWAAKSGQLKIIQHLIKRGANIESENRHRMRPLHMAIKSQNWAIVKELVEEGADINVPDGYAISPLHRTIKASKWDIAKYLIGKNADIEAYDNKGKTVRQYLQELGKQDYYKQYMS